jgi:hypothetical protein
MTFAKSGRLVVVVCAAGLASCFFGGPEPEPQAGATGGASGTDRGESAAVGRGVIIPF